MARVLLIAGSSFIGQHCARVLSAAGHDVSGTARQVQAGSGLVSLDVTNATDVDRVVGVLNPDWIVNCAGTPSSPDPAEHYSVHVQGTLHVLQAAAGNGRPSVLLMGSAAEYGPVPANQLPVTESTAEKPTTFFGSSKLAQTQLARVAAKEFQVPVIVTRPFNVVGPGLPRSYFATALAERLQEQLAAGRRDDFDVRNPEATRDFVDVRDVARAVRLLVETAAPQPGTAEVYNIATGLQTSIIDVATTLGQLADGLKPAHGGEVASRGGISRSCGSFAKLRDATGWQPEIPWRQSIADLWHAIVSASPEDTAAVSADPQAVVR